MEMSNVEFVIYVLGGDLFMELPSRDNGTFENQLLHMQREYCEPIRLQIFDLQMGSGFQSVEIINRNVWGFKYGLNTGKVTEALQIIKNFLATKNISLKAVKVVNLRF